jgi:cold shock CspA family protein
MKRSGFIEVWFDKKKFGFIKEKRNDGSFATYFLHHSNIISGTPRTGVRVQFNDGQNSKGMLALDVEILNGTNTLPSAANVLAGNSEPDLNAEVS